MSIGIESIWTHQQKKIADQVHDDESQKAESGNGKEEFAADRGQDRILAH
jgi:hypothetical protein